MSLMKVVLRTTGLTASILSFAMLMSAQTKITVPPNTTGPFPKVVAVSEDPPPPPVPSTPQAKKQNAFMRWLTGNKITRAISPTSAGATPVGVQIVMSDGTVQTAPLGIWIALATGGACSPSCPSGYQLRGVFPTQYVNQICVYHAPATAGSGAGATGTATSSSALSFTITNGGSGYINPIIVVTGGTGNPGPIMTTFTGGIITALSAPQATGYTTGDVLTITITDAPPGTWTYPKPGRNVQVWRNGLLQRLGPDYTLNTTTGTILPVLYADGNGNLVGWNTDDYVTAAYLY